MEVIEKDGEAEIQSTSRVTALDGRKNVLLLTQEGRKRKWVWILVHLCV